jgi:tetratricopeptide (TPR) repeat protein
MSILLVASILVGCEAKAPFHYMQGIEFAEEGRYDEAITEFTKAIELDPNYIKAYNYRAWIYRDKEQYADSSKAIELNPELAEAYLTRASAYIYREQYNAAIFDYSKALELDTSMGDAVYLGRALVYQEQGKNAECIAELEKFITVIDDPQMIENVKKEIEKLSQ